MDSSIRSYWDIRPMKRLLENVDCSYGVAMTPPSRTGDAVAVRSTSGGSQPFSLTLYLSRAKTPRAQSNTSCSTKCRIYDTV